MPLFTSTILVPGKGWMARAYEAKTVDLVPDTFEYETAATYWDPTFALSALYGILKRERWNR